MKDSKAGQNGGQASPTSDLSRLIELEERLGQTLAKAREEAARIVVAARDAAATAALDLDRELAGYRGRIQAEVDQEGADRGAHLVADARRAASLLDALTDQRINELGSMVVERLIGVPPEGDT